MQNRGRYKHIHGKYKKILRRNVKVQEDQGGYRHLLGDRGEVQENSKTQEDTGHLTWENQANSRRYKKILRKYMEIQEDKGRYDGTFLQRISFIAKNV
ncbi:hypothetical protein MTP99_018645 [Tenebrio molitor]|jgi:hypothetical protein|nr:hypothetical protein MTP99_018645 [Tenebrio molitor]